MDLFFTIISYVAAVGTTSALIPQIVKMLKSKDTSSISLYMYIVFNIGLVCWTSYGIYKGDWSIILANSISLVLALSILTLKIHNMIKNKEKA